MANNKINPLTYFANFSILCILVVFATIITNVVIERLKYESGNFTIEVKPPDGGRYELIAEGIRHVDKGIILYNAFNREEYLNIASPTPEDAKRIYRSVRIMSGQVFITKGGKFIKAIKYPGR